jgi:hypothetical protein
MIRLVRPDSPRLWAVARQLVEEYAASLDVDLSFQVLKDAAVASFPPVATPALTGDPRPAGRGQPVTGSMSASAALPTDDRYSGPNLTLTLPASDPESFLNEEAARLMGPERGVDSALSE